MDIIHSRLTYLSNGWTHADFNLSRTMPLVIDNIRIYVIGLVRTLVWSLINLAGMSSNSVLLNQLGWHNPLYKKDMYQPVWHHWWLFCKLLANSRGNIKYIGGGGNFSTRFAATVVREKTLKTFTISFNLWLL